jgi:hypothetical protein
MTPGGTVMNPMNAMDFMAQFACQNGRRLWISPYTYERLRSSFPSVVSASNRAKRRSGMERVETLFLSLRIYRGVEADLRPSFHYPARVIDEAEGQKTPYTVLLHAEDGRLLRSVPLVLRDPTVGPDAAVLKFYQPIPFHLEARKLTITGRCAEGCEHESILDTQIASSPPEVMIREVSDKAKRSGCLRVSWESKTALRYLVRYSPDEGRNWVGLSPGLSATEFEFDPRFLPASRRGAIQVLATDGIRTGAATCELEVDHPDLIIDVAPLPDRPLTVGDVIVAEAWRPSTGSVACREILWTSDRQGRVGRGNRLPVDGLRRGRHRVTVSVGTSSSYVDADVEGTPVGRKLAKHTSKTHPGHTSKDHARGTIRED